jgi:membrane-anchored glycerophosphoryl diester phosphodiesterase (GDPDase)
MDIGKSVGEWAKFSFTGWLRDRETLTYFISLIIIVVLATIAGNYLIYSLLYPAYSSAAPSSAEIISAMVNAIPILAVFVILNSLAAYFIAYLTIARALKLKKRGAQKLSLTRLAKFLALEIFVFLGAFLSLFNLKFLLILIAAALLYIIGAVLATVTPYVFVGGALVLVGTILLFAYFIVVVYNSIRLLLSPAAFVEKNIGIVAAAKESWKMTKGNVFNVIIAWLVLVVISFIIGFVSAVPATIYSIYYASANSGAAAASSTAAELAITTDIGYMVAMIPSYIFSAFLSIAAWFYIVSIYTGLKKGK